MKVAGYKTRCSCGCEQTRSQTTIDTHLRVKKRGSSAPVDEEHAEHHAASDHEDTASPPSERLTPVPAMMITEGD